MEIFWSGIFTAEVAEQVGSLEFISNLWLRHEFLSVSDKRPCCFRTLPHELPHEVTYSCFKELPLSGNSLLDKILPLSSGVLNNRPDVS